MKAKMSPEKRALVKELSHLGNLIRGSLVHGTRKCGKKTCSCMNGGPEHPYSYLSISTTHARNKVRYVSNKNLSKVERGVAAYKRAWEILEELSAINLAELNDDSEKKLTNEPGKKKA